MRVNTNPQVTGLMDIRQGVIPRQYQLETLSIYEEEYVYIESATWDGSEIRGVFRIEHYPFIEEGHDEYLPVSMLMLYLSQLGYIYGRILCERNLLPSGINITTEEFFRLRDKGNIIFLGFDKIKFHRKVYITESPVELKMELLHVSSIKGSPIGIFFFELANKAIVGKVKMAIVREKKG